MTTIEGLAVVTRARGAMAAAPRAIVRRPFYIATSVLMGLMAVVGFWPTYFGPLVRGTLSQPLLIHVHTVVFVGWLALFLTQVVLAAAGQVKWDLRLGRFGIGYGALVVVDSSRASAGPRTACGPAAARMSSFSTWSWPWRCFRSSLERPSCSVGRRGCTGD